jgi:hypothetical protein
MWIIQAWIGFFGHPGSHPVLLGAGIVALTAIAASQMISILGRHA